MQFFRTARKLFDVASAIKLLYEKQHIGLLKANVEIISKALEPYEGDGSEHKEIIEKTTLTEADVAAIWYVFSYMNFNTDRQTTAVRRELRQSTAILLNLRVK